MLSKKIQYAFKALVYLASQRNNSPVLISTISEEKNIPLKFLENILLELKNAGILLSKKGKGGGYALAKNPSEVFLSDIHRIIDGPIALLPCVSLHFYQKCDSCDESTCKLKEILILVRDATLKILDNKTLKDIS